MIKLQPTWLMNRFLGANLHLYPVSCTIEASLLRWRIGTAAWTCSNITVVLFTCLTNAPFTPDGKTAIYRNWYILNTRMECLAVLSYMDDLSLILHGRYPICLLHTFLLINLQQFVAEWWKYFTAHPAIFFSVFRRRICCHGNHMIDRLKMVNWSKTFIFL